MKTVVYTDAAVAALIRHRNLAGSIEARIERYALTGEGNTKQLTGSPAIRLRVGEFRVLFTETANEILVLNIGPRGGIYS